MTPSKPGASRKQKNNAIAEARQVLQDLREISRWQYGLVSRLEQTLEHLETDRAARPPARTSSDNTTLKAASD